MKTNHEWSREALFSKAQLYAEAMGEHDSNWQFGLWSSLLLEFLVRSAVATTSPVLVAENSDWNSILYALGIAPKKAKFVPKSASISDLLNRLEELCPAFTREHANFCTSHFARRNSEVHTGNLPFENLGTSIWLPMFYSVCAVLLEASNETLESLFDEETALRAHEDIEALQDETAKSVRGTLSAHQTVWQLKSEDEKATARAQAEAASLRHYGHRVTCPCCESTALVNGKAAGAAKRSVDQDGIWERQSMKPENFACIACGLKISGYSRLLAAGMGDAYTATSHYEPLEYFEVDVDRHIRNLMEDDNNEY